MLKSLVILVLLSSLVVSQTMTPEEVKKLIEKETRRLIDEIDYQAEFDKIKDEFLDFDNVWEATEIPISFGGLITLILFLMYLPPLIIIGLILACCWGFQCGCFAWKRDKRLQNRYPDDFPVSATNGALFNDTAQPKPAAVPAQGPFQEKPSLMPIRSRFMRPASRINPSSGAPVSPTSPTGSASNYQDQDNSGQW